MNVSLNHPVARYATYIGDNALILGQRLAEWCGHGPILEQDIAMTNIALDFIGQTRNLYTYAAKVEGANISEDDIAFLREERNYSNILLVEQANEDFAYTIVRQFLFDSYNYFFTEALQSSKDESIAAIAKKSLKEIAYHLKFSSEWLIRLGDGTATSHQKMQTALDDLWRYSEECVLPSELELEMEEKEIAPSLVKVKKAMQQKREDILSLAGLEVDVDTPMRSGGKTGKHTEHLGYLLSDLQYMQRAYPGQKW